MLHRHTADLSTKFVEKPKRKKKKQDKIAINHYLKKSQSTSNFPLYYFANLHLAILIHLANHNTIHNIRYYGMSFCKIT
jgi:hypothetical protein